MHCQAAINKRKHAEKRRSEGYERAREEGRQFRLCVLKPFVMTFPYDNEGQRALYAPNVLRVLFDPSFQGEAVDVGKLKEMRIPYEKETHKLNILPSLALDCMGYTNFSLSRFNCLPDLKTHVTDKIADSRIDMVVGKEALKWQAQATKLLNGTDFHLLEFKSHELNDEIMLLPVESAEFAFPEGYDIHRILDLNPDEKKIRIHVNGSDLTE